MAAKTRWWVDGHSIGLEPAFNGVRVLVDGHRASEKLPHKNHAESVRLGDGATLTVRRKRTLWGINTVLERNGVLIPPSATPLKRVGIAPGSLCAFHPQSPATLACARCGSFACHACSGADGMRCEACFARASAEDALRTRALAYAAPVVVFAVLAGPLGALFGGAAAAASVAVARTSQPRWIKLGVAGVLYAVAALAWLLAIAVLRGGEG